MFLLICPIHTNSRPHQLNPIKRQSVIHIIYILIFPITRGELNYALHLLVGVGGHALSSFKRCEEFKSPLIIEKIKCTPAKQVRKFHNLKCKKMDNIALLCVGKCQKMLCFVEYLEGNLCYD